MTKDELIARLQVLGEQLNRDVSLTGTKEELDPVAAPPLNLHRDMSSPSMR